MTSKVDHEVVIRQVVARLTERFPERDSAEIEAIAREELAAYDDRPVEDYLTVLTERATKKRLKR